MLFTFGCKKNKFEHKSPDFSYADDISGTYIGTRTKDNPSWWGAPPGAIQKVDTITVIVEDRRTNSVCGFHIDYFDKEFIIRPNNYFINEIIIPSAPNSCSNKYTGYFKNGVLHYSYKVQCYKYPLVYYPEILKLYKQE